MMRVLHGSFNSATSPLSYSLVAEFVPPEKRGTANSILSAAIYIGIALSSLSVMLIKRIGWRATWMFTGGLGIMIGCLAMLLIPNKGPFSDHMEELIKKKSKEESTDEVEDKRSTIRKIIDSTVNIMKNPVPRYITLAAVVRALGGMAVAAYIPVFFMKTYP